MFYTFHEVSRKATAPAHAPYLRPVGNSPAIAANLVELAGHFNPQKTIGTCSDHPQQRIEGKELAGEKTWSGR